MLLEHLQIIMYSRLSRVMVGQEVQGKLRNTDNTKHTNLM